MHMHASCTRCATAAGTLRIHMHAASTLPLLLGAQQLLKLPGGTLAAQAAWQRSASHVVACLRPSRKLPHSHPCWYAWGARAFHQRCMGPYLAWQWALLRPRRAQAAQNQPASAEVAVGRGAQQQPLPQACHHMRAVVGHHSKLRTTLATTSCPVDLYVSLSHCNRSQFVWLGCHQCDRAIGCNCRTKSS
jgi:hypothetical protein